MRIVKYKIGGRAAEKVKSLLHACKASEEGGKERKELCREEREVREGGKVPGIQVMSQPKPIPPPSRACKVRSPGKVSLLPSNGNSVREHAIKSLPAFILSVLSPGSMAQ